MILHRTSTQDERDWQSDAEGHAHPNVVIPRECRDGCVDQDDGVTLGTPRQKASHNGIVARQEVSRG